MTRFLITGAHGMLGSDMRIALAGRDVVALSRAELDVTDADAVAVAVADADVIINTASYTAVDAAESDEAAAFAVNAEGAGNLARAAAATGARMVQVSTDYVFRGDATTPYPEDSPLDPLSAYGRTKAEGERLVREAHPGAHIVRTAWLYGRHGDNFAHTMLKLAASKETVQVVDDQFGQPTWTRDLAQAIIDLIDSEAPAGIYHGTNAGAASWYDFAREVYAVAGLDPDRIQPTSSSGFVRPAPRPTFSVLGHDAWARAGLTAPRDWRSALRAAHAAGALDLE